MVSCGAVGCRYSPRRRVRLRSPAQSLQPSQSVQPTVHSGVEGAPAASHASFHSHVRTRARGTRFHARASCALPLAPAALGFPRFAALTAQEPRGIQQSLTSVPPPPPRSQLTAFHDLRSQKQKRLTRGWPPQNGAGCAPEQCKHLNCVTVCKSEPLVVTSCKQEP